MENKRLEYRMYGLVPYNLSPIQQGIQFGHAVVEYMLSFADLPSTKEWAENDKTFIILNGGTTNKMPIHQLLNKYKGTLNNYKVELEELGINLATFNEPDLGNQLTAVVFLVDEKVWNYEKYPRRDYHIHDRYEEEQTLAVHILPETDEDYAERLGGEQNVKLREFLSKFKLA